MSAGEQRWNDGVFHSHALGSTCPGKEETQSEADNSRYTQEQTKSEKRDGKRKTRDGQEVVDKNRMLLFRHALCLLSSHCADEAVAELQNAGQDLANGTDEDCSIRAIGHEVLLAATLGFALRELRNFDEALQAFRRARTSLLRLVAVWAETPGERSDAALFPIMFAAGVASCLKGHPMWTMCSLDLQTVLSGLEDLEHDLPQVQGGGAAHSACSNQQLSKKAGKASSADRPWLMARSEEVDLTLLVHHKGTVVALAQDNLVGSFRFVAGELQEEHTVSPQGYCGLAGTQGGELGVLKAALREEERLRVFAGWRCGEWSVHGQGVSLCVQHSAWGPQNCLLLTESGFTFGSSHGRVQVQDGDLVFSHADAEHRLPDLVFRIGISLSALLVDEEIPLSRLTAMDDNLIRQQIQDSLTSESRVVAQVVAKAQLLADGGTSLHVLSHSGEASKLGAELQKTQVCLYVAQNQRLPQQELSEGDEVRLAPEYLRYRDASAGPLRPADIGIIVTVQLGSNQPLRVSYGGRSWWYAREALEPLDPAPQKMQERCSCINCVNRSDRKGRTALHVAAACFTDRSHLAVLRELVHAGASLHLRDQLGRTPLHCLLESPCVGNKTIALPFATLRSAVKLLASETALKAHDNNRQSAILASARCQKRGAIVIFDALLNTEFDWSWAGTPETDELLSLAVKRSKALTNAPAQYRHAAESALARLLGKHIVETENDGLCACPKGQRTLSLKLPAGCEEVAVQSALDAFGICANRSDGVFFAGVQKGVSVDRLLKGGWKLHESMPYNIATKYEGLDPGKGEWLCIGAREVGKDVMIVAAMAKRGHVLRKTSGSSEVNESNGAYWYCCPGKSFGFSRNPRVELRSADTEDVDGEYRLSWHLDSDSGGWRAGVHKNLVREAGARYEKLVFYLNPSQTLASEPKERFFIGRHVTVADKHSAEETVGHTTPYQPVPSIWGLGIIEQMRASSNSAQLSRIKDGDAKTCWESDRDSGADRKHWLEFQLKPSLTIKSLGLVVQADTAKYCPRTLITLVGQSERTLKSIGQSEFLDLPMNKPVLLPLITKRTTASIIRVEISDNHLGDNCRVHGVCIELVAPGDEDSECLEALCGRVVDQGAGTDQGKLLVATSNGTRWFSSHELKPLGPTFPQSISLGNLRITSLPSAAKLRGVGSFPLQALQHLCLADNQLAYLPDDLSCALPGLKMLDLAGNKFSSLPCAIARLAWLQHLSLLRQKDTLHDKSWLDAILAHTPSFLESPPQSLESVLVDFACVSPCSQKLAVTLALRTIQRCASTCIDLRCRGLVDGALDLLLPALLECSSRRHGLLENLRNAPKLAAASVVLPLIHPHRLMSAAQSETAMASRDDCCNTCGRAKLSPASGVICEHLGCEFSLCVECAAFLSQTPSNSVVRTICAEGHYVQFCVSSCAAAWQDKGSETLFLTVSINGDPMADAVQAVQWNARKRVLTLHTERKSTAHNVQLRHDAVAGGLVVQLAQICSSSQRSGVPWRGDPPSASPVCHTHGRPMEVSAANPPPTATATEQAVQWEFEVGGSYQPFDEAAHKAVENAFQRGADMVRCPFLNPRNGAMTTYEYNLTTLLQTNTQTRYTRSIRRIPEKVAAEEWRCHECCSHRHGSGWCCRDCAIQYCLDCWPPPQPAWQAGGAASTRGSDKSSTLPAGTSTDEKEFADTKETRQKTKSPSLLNAIEVPLVDLRNNAITKLPPSLVAAVSYLSAGVILSDLTDNVHQDETLSSVVASASVSGAPCGDGDTPIMLVSGSKRGGTGSCATTVHKHHLTSDHKYKYSGEVKGNKEHGHGVRFLGDGTFECDFVDGKRHGPAVHRFKNGEEWRGTFKDDVMEKEGVLDKLVCRYEGQMLLEPTGGGDLVVQYVPHGRGTMLYGGARGCRYAGCWKQGKRHGHGTLTWPGSELADEEHGANGKESKGKEFKGRELKNRGAKGRDARGKDPKGKEPKNKDCSGWEPSRNDETGAVATYEGAWEDDMMQGRGLLTWRDGRVFDGSFMADRVERGFLVTAEGSSMQTFSENCGKLAQDSGDLPDLPPSIKREDMGMISAELMAAVKSGAAEAYESLAHVARLSVSDRIKLLSLHAAENPPEAGRQALKVKYSPGAPDAAANIMRALTQFPQRADAHGPLICIAKNLQWAIELEKPEPPAAATSLDRRILLKEDIKRELERRGLDTEGLKRALESRLEEALVLERPIKTAELKMPLLKKELETRGLDSKGLKRELVVRLEEYLDAQRHRQATATAALDEIQGMFVEVGRGLAHMKTGGVYPMILTAAESLQPEPIACCTSRMAGLQSWYAAVGRLMGGALWHRKTLPIPFSRFFCRRILEQARCSRLKAYSLLGQGPPVFSGGAAALIGTRLSVVRTENLDDMRWKDCPQPLLERVSPGIQYVVKQVMCIKGCCFLRLLLSELGHNGWMPICFTNAKVDNLIEPEAAWREMQRRFSEQPYNASFPNSVSSGQPVRIGAVREPPSFKSGLSMASTLAAHVQPHVLKRVNKVKEEEYHKCILANLSEDRARLFSEIVSDQVRASCVAECRRQEARKTRRSTQAASSRVSDTAPFRADAFGSETTYAHLCASNDACTSALVGVSACQSGEGVCVLPEWVMENLGLVDGDEVQVEALQPPLNLASHTMARGVGRFSSFWYCGRKKKRSRAGAGAAGHLAKCGPDRGEPCVECEMVQHPDCTGRLASAQHIVWRLPRHSLVGELEVALKGGEHLAAFFHQRGLQCVMRGVAVPLEWGSRCREGVEESADIALALTPEGMWDNSGLTLSEAVLSADTKHQLLPPLAPMKGTSDKYESCEQASSSGAEELLRGEMMSDYLEIAAADDMDRDHIKKNEFAWLLRNKISDLERDGLLPPRFAGISNGLISRKLVPPANTQLHSATPLASAPHPAAGPANKKRAADGKHKVAHGGKATPLIDGELLKQPLTTLSLSSVAEGVEDEFFSVLVERSTRDIGEDGNGRRELVQRWLRRRLYEEVQHQAFAVARGLREVIPAGLLALFSAPELQALLGGGPAVSDAALLEWRASTEYGNGLTAQDDCVRWFWEAIECMDDSQRASVWKFGTGLTRLPSAERGGSAALLPRFNLVARAVENASSDTRLESFESVERTNSVDAAECADLVLVVAAVCHRQIVLPRYSSAQVMAQQLVRSVEQGLADAGDADSFESVQRRLQTAVQHASAREGAATSGAVVQEALRKLFPNSYMCGKCGFGPVDHVACTDLRSHHGEKRGVGAISNACPKCAWFSPQVTDWPPWDGRVWPTESDLEDKDHAAPLGEASSATARPSFRDATPTQKRRRRESGKD